MADPSSLIGSYIGPALSLAEAGLGPNPGQAVGTEAAKLAAKEGLKYLGSQTGATDWLLSQLAGAYDWAASGIGDMLGTALPTAANLGEAAGGFSSGLAGGGGLPLAAAMAIIQNIITDELKDPGGRVSAAQDQASGYAQTMPGLIGTLAGAHQGFKGINDQVTNDQAQGLFQLLRGGVKANELMADPSAMQGQNEFGIRMPNYGGGVANLRTVAGPESVLGTIRLQDMLARRGLTPESFETATPLEREMAAANFQAQNLPGASGEYTNPHAGQPSPFDASGHLAGLGALRPDEMLSKIGFGQANLAAPENTPQLLKAYGVTADNPMPEALRKAYAFAGSAQTPTRAIYTPDVMEQLYQLKPGGYEQGLKNIVAGAPTGEGRTFLSLAGPTPPSFAGAAPAAPASAPTLSMGPSLMDPMRERDQILANVGGG
jgi:hypothetical protein